MRQAPGQERIATTLRAEPPAVPEPSAALHAFEASTPSALEPAEHVTFGAYPRRVIERLGGWVVSLLVILDFEFDYRLRAFQRNLGMRLDYAFASAALHERCVEAAQTTCGLSCAEFR